MDPPKYRSMCFYTCLKLCERENLHVGLYSGLLG